VRGRPALRAVPLRTPVRRRFGADGPTPGTRVAGGSGGNFTGVVVGMYAHAPTP
jgi:hypothetical protein